MSAQELTVKHLEMDGNDISASQYVRKDLNGLACALVKVSLSVPGAEFEGNVIPPVEFKTGEYWVYLTDGTQEFRIMCPGYISLHVLFNDYGIKKLKSNVTYNLELVPAAAGGELQNQQLTIHYSPSNADVMIDSKPYQGENGVLTTMLPVGNHIVAVAADGYVPYAGSVKLNATTPSVVSVDLENPNAAIQTFTVGRVSFNMIRVDGGTFMMGGTEEQGSEARDNEKPAHQVTLSTYLIGETEVTQALWQAVMGSNPSNFKGDNRPVEGVSWEDCQDFIQELNAATGKQFRMPTEAEWEFAARGGNNSRKTMYSGSNTCDEVAWNSHNGLVTCAVKTRASNELGIYDMSGNVSEWCQDWFGGYSSDSQSNPKGPLSGKFRIHRGGNCHERESFCRVSKRFMQSPTLKGYIGLRLVL